ncbi:hypothetical protein PVL29_009298 [Vitis rotundifolia]|uniref:Uncharacterized protein n=1 Tax=Vitis rotundifolia TaxID=103349 RepID=A0AA38ZY17_VITRO|nr:hypothetical protein PVL29_009298 [Vitis rotundifolia]
MPFEQSSSPQILTFEYEAAAAVENNKKTICVNVDGISITTDREAACKAPMSAKEAANLTA